MRAGRVTKLPVYGLKVKRDSTYVADGILTHNSIHRWAGAAEDYFQALAYPREILPVSHRLPRSVFELAGQIASRVSHRFRKDWTHSGRDGLVAWHASPDEVDLHSGTWLLLARTRAQLAPLVQLARDQGVAYRLKGWPSVDHADVAAIQAYEALRANKRIESADAAAVLKLIGIRREVDEDRTYTAGELGLDVRPIWHDALVRMALDTREYLLACLRRGEKLTAEPRVRIDTIHGSKGMEAEHVLLMTDMTWRTWRGYELDPDSEHRVFYVGATRASQTLNLIAPNGAYGYPL